MSSSEFSPTNILVVKPLTVFSEKPGLDDKDFPFISWHGKEANQVYNTNWSDAEFHSLVIVMGDYIC